MMHATRQTHGRQAFLRPFACRFSTDHPGQRDVFQRSQLRQEKISLEYETHFPISKSRLRARRAVVKISSLEFDRSRFRTLQTGERVEKRRLTCARSAGKKDCFIAAHLHRDTTQDLDPTS